MILLIRLAWRNLWRHARRSLITATAMAVGIALCMALIAITDGTYVLMFDVLVEQQLGHVQVHDPDYPEKRTLYETLHDADARLAAIDALPDTEAATGRLVGYALIGGAETSVGGQILGVIPRRENAASPIVEKVTDGEWLSDEPSGRIVLGAGLAEDLRVGVGGEVVVVTQAADGSMGNALYTVQGIVKTGSTALDKGAAYLHLRDLQELLVLPDQVHEIQLRAKDTERIEPYAESVRGAVGDGALVRPWWTVSPQIHGMMAMQDGSAFMTIGLVLTVSAIGVVNTLLMSVFERTRELGVLKAIGIRPWRMVAMVLLEALFLAGLSTAIGLAFGGVLDYLLIAHGIDLSGSMPDGWSAMGMTIDPVLRGAFRWAPLGWIVSSVFIVSLLAALWPAMRAARLQPVESIRAD